MKLVKADVARDGKVGGQDVTVPHEVIHPAVEITDGFWINEKTQTIYKVVKSPRTGNLYAKELEPHGSKAQWEYVGQRPFPGLRSDGHLLSRSEAQEFGKLYGFCIRCGATLTDEESIERGIGPICYANWGM